MRLVDGIAAARKRHDPIHDCGSVYSKTDCPKCKTRKMVMWSSSKHKDFWKCGCGWNSYEGRK